GNHLLSLMLITGGLGTLVLGPAADRFGRRPVLAFSSILTAPLVFVFVAVGGVAGAVALGLIGCAGMGTFGVTMVMGPAYLPRRVAMASGLVSGLSIGLGGIAAVALGALADTIDLRTALYVCAASPLIALVLTLLLPSGREHAPVEPEFVAAGLPLGSPGSR